MHATFKKYTLHFKRPGGTSRGVMHTKDTYFIRLQHNGSSGVGECGLFRGLSSDDRPDYEEKLKWACDNIGSEKAELLAELTEFPSIQFGLEQALLSLKSTDGFLLFPSKFTTGEAGIPINGLIWMGSPDFMKQQIKNKLDEGFTTIKLKIGAIDFDSELNLLKNIRTSFSENEIELRVDANGAFSPDNALEKLKRLSDFQLHSIEQPIPPKQWREMAALCEVSPVPIALDEELIGIFTKPEKDKLVATVKPQYVILKPSLIGGFKGTKEWISSAEKNGAGWWITSALESNIGLNAIAQFTYTLPTTMPQGLGTGGLFANNFPAPLKVIKGALHYNPKGEWKVDLG